MTPKQIAHDIIEQENVYLAQAYQLAQAYLQLESRIQKLEAVAEAAKDLRNMWHVGSIENHEDIEQRFEDSLIELEQE